MEGKMEEGRKEKKEERMKKRKEVGITNRKYKGQWRNRTCF